MQDLSPLLTSWPVPSAALGITSPHQTLGLGHTAEPQLRVRVASLSKCVAAYAGLIATEEGTIGLTDQAGPPGATVHHLLSHASGLAFDDRSVLAPPGTRRMYSNAGIEVFAEHLAAQAGMPFAQYQAEAVLGPLAMTNSALVGSPAHGLESTVEDLLRFARELLRPTLIDPATLAMATEPQFPELRGVLPGVGTFDPNPWGLGFELRANKQPHWTGTNNAPQTFGHFGGTGTFLWVDPAVSLAAVGLTTREFGPWALKVWPDTSDELLDQFSAR